jgi:nuclear pore complex protein Nup107
MDLDLDDASPLSVIESGPEVEEFANALDDCLSPLLKPAEKRRRLLELPQKYYDNAVRRLSHHDPRRARLSYDEMDVEGDDGDYTNDTEERGAETRRLEKEVQTWDLFRRLLPLRYAERQGKASLRQSVSAQSTSGDLLHQFLESDTLAQERRAVLQWLQSNAASRPDIDDLVQDLQQNADRGDIIAHGWLHTRSSIKLRKGVTSWSGLLDKQSPNVSDSHSTSKGDPLVTQLDPDATTRQDRKLQPQDEFFERAIWLGCFEHLRRGSSLDTIRDWCAERTEMWRSISMSAMLLSVDDKDPVPDTDASSLALWRRMCYGLARQGGTDDYERAVYGVLSGDVPSVEKVSKNWDDQLFAKYNSLLRTQFDHFLLSLCPADVASDLTGTFSTFDTIQFHTDKDASAQLISSLATHPEFGKEAREPNKALQAALIANELGKYLYDQGRAISETADAEDQLIFASASRAQSVTNMESFFQSNDLDGLRIVAHVFLLTTLLDSMDGKQDGSGATSAEDVQGNTLAGYTTFLRRANLKELIPLYCSVLERPRCYEVLTSNMILETDPESRRNQLRLMKKVGIDIGEYVRFQASVYFKGLGQAKPQSVGKRKLSILDDKPSSARAGKGIKADFFGSDEDEVEDLHQYMARSLEWMMLIDETWPDVFAYGAQAYKFFLSKSRECLLPMWIAQVLIRV